MTACKLRKLVLFLASATLATVLAQAQQPSQGSQAPAQVAASSKPATSPSAGKAALASDSASAKAAASAKKPADPDAQLIKDARNAGFKPEMIRGTQMFCRTAVELGSHFPVRTCYDEDQVKIKIHEYQTERNQLEQMHNLGSMTH